MLNGEYPHKTHPLALTNKNTFLPPTTDAYFATAFTKTSDIQTDRDVKKTKEGSMDTIITGMVDQLTTLLKEEAKVLERILSLEEKKYQALKDVNLEQLMKVNEQEEFFIQEIHSLETKRTQIFSHLQIYGMGENFSTFINSLDDPSYQNELKNIYLHLADLRDRIKIQNEENKQLIQLNSEIISMTLGLFQQTHGETYSSPHAPIKKENNNSFLVNHVV